MKLYLAALLLAFGVLPASASENPAAPPKICGADGTFKSFLGPGRVYRVTIRSKGGIVSTLELPRGVYLSIYGAPGSTRDEASAATDLRKFSGDLTLRIRRADEIVEGESNVATDIMSKAPFAVELKNVTVEVAVEEGES